jgi:predicted permease
VSLRRLIARFGEYLRSRRVERDLDDELAGHLDHLTDEYIRRGLDRDDARRAARRDLGGLDRAKELVRDQRGFRVLDALAQDVRHSIRLLVKAPAFTTVAVLTLALGIGVNTAIFSLVDSVMLRPLPYADPDRLVAVWEARLDPRPSAQYAPVATEPDPGRMSVAPANFVDYQRATDAFSLMAGYANIGKNLTGGGTPERLVGEEVSHEYFDVLGAVPALGRSFVAGDDGPSGRRLAILSDGLWRRRFQGDPAVIGRLITLDADSYEVVGVMPATFQAVTQVAYATPVSFWIPALYSAELLANHADHEISVVARLGPGVSLTTARSQLKSVVDGLAKQYPKELAGITADARSLRADVTRNFSTSLLILLLAVGLILLIACVNVANLLLIRAVSKQHEIAIRVALGASRGRIIAGLMTQSLILAIAGAVVGLVLGAWTQDLLVRLAPVSMPRLADTTMDARVFTFTLAAAMATTIVFGLLPAWHAGRARPIDAIKSHSRASTDAGVLRWRSLLMVTEVALSTMLLVGAGLTLRSFIKLNGVDLGFATDRVLAMSINLPETKYPDADSRLRFYQTLVERLEGRPGIGAIGFANQLPLRGGWGSGIQIEGVRGPNGEMFGPDCQAVSPGYFPTLGIRLVRGRLIESIDRKETGAIAVVSEHFGRRFLQGGDPIGLRIRRGPAMPWITIVGVVTDVRRDGRESALVPQVYFSAAQTTLYPVRLSALAVRSDGDPTALLPMIQAEVWAMDRDQPVTAVRTLGEILWRSASSRRFQTLLFGLFALLALILAAIGIYGVIAYAVSKRTPEIGVRMVLGADAGRILRWVLGQAAWLVAVGAVTGLAGALLLSRYIATLLFEIQPTDTLTYVVSAAVLVGIAFVTVLLAARGASRVDPVVALRTE